MSNIRSRRVFARNCNSPRSWTKQLLQFPLFPSGFGPILIFGSSGVDTGFASAICSRCKINSIYFCCMIISVPMLVIRENGKMMTMIYLQMLRYLALLVPWSVDEMLWCVCAWEDSTQRASRRTASSLIIPMNCWELISFFGSVLGTSLQPPTYASVNVSYDDGSDDEIRTLNWLSDTLKSSSAMRLIRSQCCFNLFRWSNILSPSLALVQYRLCMIPIVVWWLLVSCIASRLDQLSWEVKL